MCITGPCADPTEPGIWWRDDNCWVKYTSALSDMLKQAMAAKKGNVELGVITSKVHPLGQAYVADLKSMVQTNVKSGNKRPIFVVEENEESEHSEVENASSEETACEGSKVPNVLFKSKEGELEAYSSDTAREIVIAAATGAERVSFTLGADEHVCVNFRMMKETRHTRGKIAPKVIIELPWKKNALKKSKMDAKKTLQKELIAGLIEGLLQSELIEEVVRQKFTKFCSAQYYGPGYAHHMPLPLYTQALQGKGVCVNQHLKQKHSAPKAKFITALIEKIQQDKSVTGEILDILSGKKFDNLSHLEYVFHGTPHQNRQPILEGGLSLERAKQRSGAFYVALDPKISVDYFAGSPPVLIILLELKFAAQQLQNVQQQNVHIVPVTHPEWLLPIGEVSLS